MHAEQIRIHGGTIDDQESMGNKKWVAKAPQFPRFSK
jgi:hypothetical protein